MGRLVWPCVRLPTLSSSVCPPNFLAVRDASLFGSDDGVGVGPRQMTASALASAIPKKFARGRAWHGMACAHFIRLERTRAPQRTHRIFYHHTTQPLTMTVEQATSGPSSSSSSTGAPTFASLEETLCSPSPPTPLDAQFRSLFTIKSLATSDPSQLPEAIRIIGRSLATSDSALLKHELAYVLGQMQDVRAIPTLTKVLEDTVEHAMVRHEAAEAMGAIADPVALEILEKYRHDEDVSVRETCELAIKKIEYENKAGKKEVKTQDTEK